MVATAGADRFMTVDLHAGQIQGFFDIPCDELSAFPLLSHYFTEKAIPNLVVVAADLGFAKKARNFAEILHAPVAFVEKRRDGREVASLGVIGDVRGCNVLIVDDEVDQGGTVAGAAHILREAGAGDIYLSFVHATFSPGALERLESAGFKEIVCTDTERMAHRDLPANLRIIHLGPWLARIIGSVHQGRSVGNTLAEFEAGLD
jgi:ribose-phosphate pyrophosphokinase